MLLLQIDVGIYQMNHKWILHGVDHYPLESKRVD